MKVILVFQLTGIGLIVAPLYHRELPKCKFAHSFLNENPASCQYLVNILKNFQRQFGSVFNMVKSERMKLYFTLFG